MDPRDAEEQLGLLRELTRTTSTLHEAQILQLKIWPRLFFRDSTASEFAWTLEIDQDAKEGDPKRVQGQLEFVVTGPPAKNLLAARARDHGAARALAGRCRWLLGDEWSVRVRVVRGERTQDYGFARV